MEIYIDGGYSTPKNKGCYAFIVVEDSHIKSEFFKVVDNSTSYRMELMALLEALKYLKGLKEEVTIFTDSMNNYKGYKYWAEGWSKNNWKKSNGKDIKHRDLWEQIYSLKSDLINVLWIKGHSKSYFNNYVDKLTRNY